MTIAILVFTLIWACIATLMVVRNPFPFPDRGHRCFSVRDEKARQSVVKTIEAVSGMRARFTFDFGTTHQTVFRDGTTTILHVEPNSPPFETLPANVISLAVAAPVLAAKRAVEILCADGYEARMDLTMQEGLPPDHFALVFSNAFDGWVLAFRKPLRQMPRPQIRAGIRY